MFIKGVIIFALLKLSASCNVRNYSAGMVCVCNSDYCDTVPDFSIGASSGYALYYTSNSSLGFNLKYGSFNADVEGRIPQITIKTEHTYQTMIGFGSALTDSAGIVIASLTDDMQDTLLGSYFGDEGIDLTLIRVPIAGTDYSTRPYSYDDVPGDRNLTYFHLQAEDFELKIPYIHKAFQLKNQTKLKLFATAWTAPPWMKSIQSWGGPGQLKLEYYETWAKYQIKFFEEYLKENITFWAMSTGNEPYSLGFSKPPEETNAMSWTVYEFNKYVGDYLGPALKNSTFSYLKLMLHDDQRNSLHLVKRQLNKAKVLNYTDGVAVHWYTDCTTPPDFLTFANSSKKDIFTLSTEASIGNMSIGNWTRAEMYIKDIMQDIKYNVSGWVDWNMALNTTGGPTWTLNNLDSNIIVNATANEFLKQPTYYALGHFAKFVKPGSKRIGVSTNYGPLGNVTTVAFRRPDDYNVLIIYNGNDRNSLLDINVKNTTTSIEVEGKSINTMIWQ